MSSQARLGSIYWRSCVHSNGNGWIYDPDWWRAVPSRWQTYIAVWEALCKKKLKTQSWQVLKMFGNKGTVHQVVNTHNELKCLRTEMVDNFFFWCNNPHIITWVIIRNWYIGCSSIANLSMWRAKVVVGLASASLMCATELQSLFMHPADVAQ